MYIEVDACVQVVKVKPRGTSREHKYGRIDRDYNVVGGGPDKPPLIPTFSKVGYSGY